MKRTRKGIAAIIFMNISGKRKYLLFKRKMHWKGWEWMKGGLKAGENELMGLRREVKEETGRREEEYKIKRTKLYHKFNYERPFIQDKKVWDGARNKVFLIEFFDKKVWIGKMEHEGYRWFSRKEALKKITWPDQQKIFKKLAL